MTAQSFSQPKLKAQADNIKTTVTGSSKEPRNDPFTDNIVLSKPDGSVLKDQQQANLPAKAARGKDAAAAKATAAPKSRGGSAGAAAASAPKEDVAKPPRQPRDQEAAAHTDSAQAQEAQRQAPQPVSGRSRPGSQRNSAAGAAPRTGEEIWQLNMQLGKIAEQLADPEDAKQGRRRYKSPTLQEKLHKQWGGTYGDKLEKDLAPMDVVEEPPAPKYEPPTFLDDEASESDKEEEQPSSTADAAARPPTQQQPQASALDPAPEPGASNAATAGAGSKRGATGGSRKGAAKAASKPAAAAAAEREAVECIDLETADGEEQAAAVGKSGNGVAARDEEPAGAPSTSGRDLEPAQDEQPAKRGTRRTKAAEVGTASKAPARRPTTRRAGRDAATPAPIAEASAEAPEEQAGDSDVDVLEQAPPPAAAGPGQGRARKSHLPPNVTFGQASIGAAYKPSLPPPPPASEEAAGGDSAATGAAAMSKRVRDAGAAADEKARQSKALRLEAQQLKEMETLKLRNTELEEKLKEQLELVKQLQGEHKAAEKRAQQAEKAQERLQEQLCDRDEKISRLREELATVNQELKQVKASEAKLAKFRSDFDQFAKNSLKQ